MPACPSGRANLRELVAGHQPRRIDELAGGQVEIDEREVEISMGMEVRRREANLDLVFQVNARRAFDLIEPEIVGAERRAGPVVAARVVQRDIGLELAWPGQDVGLVDPVFDDPSELGIAWTPAAVLWHAGKSDSRPPPCPSPRAGEGNKVPSPRGEGVGSNFGWLRTLVLTDAYSGGCGGATLGAAKRLRRRAGECPEADAGRDQPGCGRTL